MSWNWNERATKASAKHFIGGDAPKVVYAIGKYEVTVPGDEVEVTYCVPRYRHDGTDPRSTFPNMDVTDGEIRIPVTDIVDEILSRIEPVELAKALWQNEDVKSEFMECLAERWSEQGINDTDRRAFLTKVQAAVHSAALDKLSNTMAKLEYEMSRNAHHYQEINRINETLRNLDVKVPRSRVNDAGEWVSEPVLLQFNELDRPTKAEDGKFTKGELEISGKAWTEAREHWRAEVSKRFSTPAPAEPSHADS